MTKSGFDIEEKALTDLIADAISDSMDYDWTARDGARSTYAALVPLLTEIRELRAENARLREALVAEREDNLWNCFETGHVNGDQWTHCFMSDGEWLAKECGFDPKQGHYNADEIRSAIPIAARAALGEPQ